MKTLRKIFLLFFIFILCSCKKDVPANENKKLKGFDQDTYEVKVSMEVKCSFTEEKGFEFESMNEKIFSVIDYKDDYALCMGKKEGAALLKAYKGGVTYNCVINVKNKDSSRQILEENKLYLVDVEYYKDNCIASLFFIKEGKPDIYVKDGFVHIPKDNGKDEKISLNDFLYMTYELYE